MTGFHESVGQFVCLTIQFYTAAIKLKWEKQTEKCFFLVKTNVAKVFLWGHNLKLEKGNKLQYIAEYRNIFKITIILYRDNIVSWDLW